MPVFDSVTRAGRRAARAAQRLVSTPGDGIVILAYHLIGAGTGSPVDLPLALFRRQLEELRDTFEFISLDAAVDRLRSGAPSAPAIVVTVDDGYDNFRTTAWPVLDRLNLPVTLYAPAGFLEGAVDGPLTSARHLPALEWGALRAMVADSRVTVGSHGFAHRDLRSLPSDAIAMDVRRARQTIEDRLGRAVPHFCYPRARWSSAAERVVRDWHDTGAADGGRMNRASGSNPYRLSRIPVRADMPSSLLRVVGPSVWLEEWVAAQARALRPRAREQA